ncbi:MAG TPA: PadR family transcriptional regulator [Candidatus Sumerlaeota bacterium]|nr:PadR family transcriptional regulator [Candidatus Sumerlaeota bacterium]
MLDLNQCACSGKTLARLLRPALLALLARDETHGYDLVQQIHGLPMFADTPPDTSGIYKLLKTMELEGLVAARWELGESGPAKRRYALTSEGQTCLARWSETLEIYRGQIEGLLALLPGNRKSSPGGARRKCGCGKAG